jgi:hypothetical protein
MIFSKKGQNYQGVEGETERISNFFSCLNKTTIKEKATHQIAI